MQSWVFSTCVIGTSCNSRLLSYPSSYLKSTYNSQTPFHIATNSQSPFFLSSVASIQIGSLPNALASLQPRYPCTKEHHLFQDSKTSHYKPMVHRPCKCNTKYPFLPRSPLSATILLQALFSPKYHVITSHPRFPCCSSGILSLHSPTPGGSRALRFWLS